MKKRTKRLLKTLAAVSVGHSVRLATLRGRLRDMERDVRDLKDEVTFLQAADPEAGE